MDTRGSQKYLYRIDTLQAAIRYTLHEQGDPMCVFLHEKLDPEQFNVYDAETNHLLREFLLEEHVIDERGNLNLPD